MTILGALKRILEVWTIAQKDLGFRFRAYGVFDFKVTRFGV